MLHSTRRFEVPTWTLRSDLVVSQRFELYGEAAHDSSLDLVRLRPHAVQRQPRTHAAGTARQSMSAPTGLAVPQFAHALSFTSRVTQFDLLPAWADSRPRF